MVCNEGAAAILTSQELGPLLTRLTRVGARRALLPTRHRQAPLQGPPSTRQRHSHSTVGLTAVGPIAVIGPGTAQLEKMAFM
jgi:hypothetical protein